MARISTVSASVDFEQDGKQTGYLTIPHSPHEDAWGATRLPVCVIRNGAGPTAILMAGNHGDEYEGQIALGELIRTLDPAGISGRLIILPALNLPAVVAGRRTSPVDGLNLNRTFPGDPAGSISQQITAYLSDVIYPLGDALVDLHSGGSSLDILPSAIVEPASDPAHMRRNVEAVMAFDAPLTVVISNLGEPRTSTAAAVRAGLTTVGTEMAGQGTVSRETLALCRRGVRNVLAHVGILPADAATRHNESARTVLEIPGSAGYVYATRDGIFEGAHALGDSVQAGQQAGLIHDIHAPWREPEPVFYGANGILFGRRQPGRVTHGNCCAVVAAPYAGDL
ncbi:succinylglutamate desuccinylase/aspartoacylase family protein [Microbaculum marinisediminis]|uniref:Succinylglutamate desuccinylase/aspartoacylase family protein n=1 Tax=Microbaculum marinisediminis TaxID=2931392 RepID=A0AAW5QV80_9HYPH|nr:succinylglutamate desuccinylase/aspartoacylase family protein [Microbaculum sp. A6E488]MCT8970915.1 succinylglutamate desuccinylase/aspartoacylase family protein [Microbaculum sp. A6E488]